MKVLYINKTLSGPMASLARFVGQHKPASSVFMAERWPREAQVPGVMLMRIPEANIAAAGGEAALPVAQSVEGLLLRNASNASNVASACIRLRKSGFTPDVIYVTAHGGYCQDIWDIFPEARVVMRSDWFYPSKHQALRSDCNSLRIASYERMFNTFQFIPLVESTVGITSSYWQKSQFNDIFKYKIHVVNNGVDTHLFKPSKNSAADEVIMFSCQGTSQVRGINIICECLPELLTLRPRCRVNIVSFASRGARAAKEQHAHELAEMLPPLNQAQRQRVNIVVLPAPAQYCELLQQATLYIYLTAPAQLTAGILEAMSCGTLVLASATEPVGELIEHNKNGILWDGKDAHSLAFEIAQLCAHTNDFQDIRQNARAAILARHDARSLLPYHASTVLEALPGEPTPNFFQ